MKKSLIALVIGVAALGFAQNAQATYTAEVSGTLTGSASSTNSDSFLSLLGFSSFNANAFDEATNTHYVELTSGINKSAIALMGKGEGSIDALASFNSLGQSSETNMTVASTSAVSLTAINGDRSELKVSVSDLSASGGVTTLPAASTALAGFSGLATSKSEISAFK